MHLSSEKQGERARNAGILLKIKKSGEATPNKRTWRLEGVVDGTAPDTLCLLIVKYGTLRRPIIGPPILQRGQIPRKHNLGHKNTYQTNRQTTLYTRHLIPPSPNNKRPNDRYLRTNSDPHTLVK